VLGTGLGVRLIHAARSARVHHAEQLHHEPRAVVRGQLPLHHDQLPAAPPVPPAPAGHCARVPPLPALAGRRGRPLAAVRRVERGASDGAGHDEQRRVSADVPHRYGEPGPHENGAQAAEEPARGVKVSEAQTGAHHSPGGQSEGAENGQRGTVEHGVCAAGPGGPTETESHDAREQWLSAHVGAQSEVLLKRNNAL